MTLALGCAASGGVATVPVRDAATDTGPRRDVVTAADHVVVDAARDAATPPDAPAADDAPADDAGTFDAGAPRDVSVVDIPPVDVGSPVSVDVPPIVLGDVWLPERDAGSSTPHDTATVASGAPADSATHFGGAVDGTRAPTLVYPEAGTILPPNLAGFEVHFIPAAGTDLFEVAFAGDRGVVRLYTRCVAVGGGCVASFDEATYAEIARVSQPGEALTLTVRATAMAGGGVGGSATRSLGMTNANVRGGIYYWAAASGTVLRYEWGRTGARAEPYLQGGIFDCVGCHTLSRDGSRMIAGRGIPGPSVAQVLDVASRGATSAGIGSNFATFSPDARWLLTSDGARLTLRDGVTAAEVPGLPGAQNGSMPDWSRNGRTVVFSRPRTVIPFFGSPGHNAPADLLTMAWNGSAFAAPAPFVTAASNTENDYYPAFSPDDAWVVFNRSSAGSDNAIDAHLWLARADRSTGPQRLVAADGPGDLGNSWPKWVPYLQLYQGEPLLWVTFSSRRDYGLRLRQQSTAADMRTVQLWMAAIRPTHATGGADPSAPAFWLPFQDLRSGNHIAQWAEQVQRQTCRVDSDCAPGERCLPAQNATLLTYSCVAP